MELELAKQGKELVVEHEARMNIIKEEVERDIRSQLRRQAAAAGKRGGGDGGGG